MSISAVITRGLLFTPDLVITAGYTSGIAAIYEPLDLDLSEGLVTTLELTETLSFAGSAELTLEESLV